MPELVYLLCALTSLGCTVLLWRSYSRQKTRLLLWSGLCFIVFALNNALLFLDLVVTGPTVDLSMWRQSTACIAMAVLLGGLIWDAK